MSHNERNYLFFQVLSRIETSYASIRGKDCRDCRFDCFCRCRATLSHLMCPSEDSWECRTDTVLKVLSNIESSHASIRGLLIVQIVLLLLMLSNIESSYASIRGLLGVHFLFCSQALSNIELCYASIRGLLGVQNVLCFFSYIF